MNNAKFRLEKTLSDRLRWAVTEVSTGQVKENFRTREEARRYLREAAVIDHALTTIGYRQPDGE